MTERYAELYDSLLHDGRAFAERLFIEQESRSRTSRTSPPRPRSR